jgi:hypothetical protein
MREEGQWGRGGEANLIDAMSILVLKRVNLLAGEEKVKTPSVNLRTVSALTIFWPSVTIARIPYKESEGWESERESCCTVCCIRDLKISRFFSKVMISFFASIFFSCAVTGVGSLLWY